jgi:hypothetical protein
MLESARAMFPLMPDEVFQAWIVPMIEFHGWPFESVDDLIFTGKWPYLLLGQPLANWADAIWAKESREYATLRLASESTTSVMNIATSAFHGVPDETASKIAHSGERARRCLSHVIEHGSIPGFLTVLDGPRGELTLVDGHHRLAACWQANVKGMKVDLWIAHIGR